MGVLSDLFFCIVNNYKIAKRNQYLQIKKINCNL